MSVVECAGIERRLAAAPGNDPLFASGMKLGISVEAIENFHYVASRIKTPLHALGSEGFDRVTVNCPGCIVG